MEVKMKKKLTLMAALCMALVCLMSMTAAAAGTATIAQCIISGSNQITVVASVSGVTSDDGNLYLFELKPYQSSITGRTDYCATAANAATVTFVTTLDQGTANSKLYSKFVIAAVQGGKFTQVSQEFYITNPEALATHTAANPVTTSIKGITADNAAILALSDLGVQHVSYELAIDRFFQAGATIPYVYNGKTYNFNQAIVAEYDMVMTLFAVQNVEVTMNIVNYYSAATALTVKPGARVSGYRHYAFNTDEQLGAESIEALMSFLASRYSNQATGLISNWIIGNEVNNNNPWYYAGNYNVTNFTAEYEKAFRMCYNAIKSENANARVLTCIDQRWNWEDGTANQYAAKKFIDAFTTDVAMHGNVDWGVAWHPHPVPLTAAKFWDMPSAYKALKLIDHTSSTKMINPQNMEVFTNYMAQPAYLSPTGQVRYIIVSEILFNSQTSNEATQAASFAYAYKLAEQNPYIKGFIVHRTVDNVYEKTSDGISCGLYNCDANGLPTTTKQIYDVFKYIDTAQSDAYTAFALPIIGASSWAALGVK
jgi:hypothetical protein